MTSPLTGMLLFEAFRHGQLENTGTAEQVKVFIKTEYGALHVTVTDEGNSRTRRSRRLQQSSRDSVFESPRVYYLGE